MEEGTRVLDVSSAVAHQRLDLVKSLLPGFLKPSLEMMEGVQFERGDQGSLGTVVEGIDF